jgi:hypothetical protein
MADLCPVCGANYALVGRVHRCRPVPVANKPAVTNTVTNKKGAAARQARRRERDPEKYRAYQAELMRKRRAAEKGEP